MRCSLFRPREHSERAHVSLGKGTRLKGATAALDAPRCDSEEEEREEVRGIYRQDAEGSSRPPRRRFPAVVKGIAEFPSDTRRRDRGPSTRAASPRSRVASGMHRGLPPHLSWPATSTTQKYLEFPQTD